MRDQAISGPRVAKLHPKVRQEVREIIERVECELPISAQIRVVQGLRTKEEQDVLYAQGRTKPGSIVTNAKFGQSYHCYGLAIDFALMYDKNGDGKYETLSWDVNYDFDKDGIKDWQEVVQAFTKRGWVWGGSFKSIPDDPHLEKSFGYPWRQLLDMYNAKKMDQEGYLLV